MQLAINRVINNEEFVSQIRPANSGFVPNGRGRQFSKQYSHPLWEQAFSLFNLIPEKVEPTFGIFTGHHYKDGAHTHLHKDVTVDGYTHVRCNVMLKKPKCGGDPVIDGETIIVKEGQIWLLLASEEMHGSTPIKDGERVIFSFGGLVSNEQIKPLIRK